MHNFTLIISLFLTTFAYADMSSDVKVHVNSFQNQIKGMDTSKYLDTSKQKYSETKNGSDNGLLTEASNKEARDTSFYTDQKGNQYSVIDLITKNMNKRESHIPAVQKNYAIAEKRAELIKFDNISGKYIDCKQAGGREFLTRHVYNCDVHKEFEDIPCIVGLNISVKPTYQYSCEQKRVVTNHKCQKDLHLHCKNISDHCAAWGLEIDSIQGDMATEYNKDNGILRVGIDQIQQWSSGLLPCLIYDREITFEITGLDKITEFTFIDRYYDDYAIVKLNSKQIGPIIGPDQRSRIGYKKEATDLDVRCLHVDLQGNIRKVKSSDALGKCPENTRAMAYLGNEMYLSCELYTNWYDILNINVKPYLREGKNSLWIRTIVGGGGEFWGHFRVKQRCCDNWVEEWNWSSPECAQNQGVL